jgi:hypothetical protein
MDADGRVVMDNGYSFSFKDGVSAEFLDAPATVDLVYEGMNAVTSIADSVLRTAKGKIAEVRGELAELRLATERERATIAELRATIAELKATVGEVSFVCERLKIERRGPPGHQGARGVDGPAGPRGEKGEPGEQGSPAVALAAWEPRVEQFQLVPAFADGTRGPPISLRPFFEAYDAATNGSDDE